VSVYEALMAAGAGAGITDAGYRAIESCRLEKGYRAWGSDIGPDHTPVEAGLGWAVKTGRPTPFRGREAIERQLAGGVHKMLATFVVDDPDVVLLGRETIYRDGQRVGWLTSGGFGHTIGRPIGMGYVRDRRGVTAEHVLAGSYELEVATERVACQVTMRALHDPTMSRIKA
jgi:4-methylaminobutanoate oxidase (formaldehyde-forming)